MNEDVDITLHEGEPWKITFNAHESDGTTPMPLLSGADVEFVIVDEDGEVKYQASVGYGITIKDDDGGVAEIAVTVADQEHNGISSSGSYFYSIRTITDRTSEQVQGRLKVEHSLFAAPISAQAIEFHLRFPEFTEDDGVVSLYLRDATAIVDSADVGWSDADRAMAILYYAAHLLQMRYIAAQSRTTGGGETGPVLSIRVEDRSVSYGDPRQGAALKSGLSESYYGKQYLMLRRRYADWLTRT